MGVRLRRIKVADKSADYKFISLTIIYTVTSLALVKKAKIEKIVEKLNNP